MINETVEDKCVYWQFCEEYPHHFVSLHGRIIRIFEDKQEMYRFKTEFIDEKSRKSLQGLFLSLDGTQNSLQLNNLLESVNQQARRHLEEVEEGNMIAFKFIMKPPLRIGEKEYQHYEHYEYTQDECEVDELEKMIQQLRRNGIRLSDLTEEEKEEENGNKFELEECERLLEESICLKDVQGKIQNLSELHGKLLSGDDQLVNADILLPLLTFSLIKMKGGHRVLSELKIIEREHLDLSGIQQYILTNFSAAIEVIREISNNASVHHRHNKRVIEETSKSPPGHFASLISSFASLGQMPKALATSISSSLRPQAAAAETTTSVTTSDTAAKTEFLLDASSEELIVFRERILATNSPNDLRLRDINLMLEDYKNLLYVLLKLSPK